MRIFANQAQSPCECVVEGDLSHWLRNIPLTYGVWHAYKYVVIATYRRFMPLLSLIEAARPTIGEHFLCFRKLAYMEKVIAGLLIARQGLEQRLLGRIQLLERHGQDGATISSGTTATPALVLLRGLHCLLFEYVPMMFRIGCLVRSCNWDGRDNGSANFAHEAMCRSFCMLVHLRQDAEKVEYVRTLGVALLMWGKWDYDLPGCMFMEESCEALLSRMAHRCRQHQHLFAYQDVFDLFVTVPSPKFGTKDRVGGLSENLVRLFTSRSVWFRYSPLRRLPYQHVQSSSIINSVILRTDRLH